MKYKPLADTGLYISELCLGTMTFGGTGRWAAVGQLGQKEADELVGRALEAGINFFDTANVYSTGQSEMILGKALGARRQEVIVATKVHSRMGEGVNEVGQSRVHIRHQVEQSLKRLGTDYIDLYQLHHFDWVASPEDALRTLDDLVRAGKVRYIGCSNMAAWQVMKFLGLSRQHNLEPFKSIQSYYSLAGRDIEREIVPLVKDQHISLLVWSPLAGGFLSGKFTRAGASDPDARRTKFDFPPLDQEQAYDIIDVAQEIARAHDVSVAQIALAWLLHQDHVTSVIIGAKRLDQLNDNLSGITVELSDEELRRLDEVSALRSEYPAWMFASQTNRLPGG
jgi:aryl-alcohol dehydrogenase-like predicted oxidoreductase